jgi:3-hydroxyacyl-[acyl-carrier-protein] dehydratase
MSNELYRISSCQQDDGSIVCTVRYNNASEIFGGHFPGRPIVPGVCTLQMIADLLQETLQKKLRLVSAPNVKFLQLITPDIEPVATITWTVSDNAYTASASLTDGAATLFKMNAVYIEKD